MYNAQTVFNFDGRAPNKNIKQLQPIDQTLISVLTNQYKTVKKAKSRLRELNAGSRNLAFVILDMSVDLQKN